MKCFLWAAFSLLFTCSVLQADSTLLPPPAWRNVQISGSGCWVTGMIAQPKVRGLFYIRTDVGGCYRWEPTSETWIPITEFIPVQQRDDYGCESIAVDPDQADTVYIACGEWLKSTRSSARPGVIYKSANRGKTWTALGLTGIYMGANEDHRWGGERLAVQPMNGKLLLFGSRTQGLWRSTDGGAHWQQTSLPYPQSNNTNGVQAVAFDPRDPRTVYAAVSKTGVFKSTDSGTSWVNISTNITSPLRLMVGPDGAVWVTYENGVSRFSGNQWTDCTPAGANKELYCGLAINPRDPKNVLVSYGLWTSPQPDAIFETLDGGASWKDLEANITTDVPWYNNGNPGGIKPDDISTFVFDPNNPKSVWFVSGGGIWNTPDITQPHPTFLHKERGHEELCVLALAAPPSGTELLAGVMDVDGFAFDRGIDSYPSRGLGLVGSWASATAAIAYEESDPRHMARLCVRGSLWGDPSIVAVSQDGGRTWDQDTSFPSVSPSGDGKALTPISVAVSAADPDDMVVAVADSGNGRTVWLCKNGASGWHACTGLPDAGAPQLEIQPLAADPVAPNTFYAYVNGVIYRSMDGGRTFAQRSAGPVGAPGPASFFKLAAQSGRAGDLWLSEESDNPNYLGDGLASWDGLYRSPDGGRTWTKLPGVSRALTFAFGMPDPSAPHAPQTLYVYGRRDGDKADAVFRSTDLGGTWANIQHPGQAIGDYPWIMEGSRQTFGRVFLGTGGRGIFYSKTKSTGSLP